MTAQHSRARMSSSLLLGWLMFILGLVLSIGSVLAREANGVRLFRHRGQVSALAFSPDGRTLATATNDGTIHLWDVALGKDKGEDLRVDEPVFQLAFTPDGKTLAVGTDARTGFWDVATKKKKKKKHSYKSWCLGIISPDGQSYLSEGPEGVLLLREIQTGKRSVSLQGHTAPIRGAVFISNGKQLVTADSGTARLWDAATGELLSVLARDLIYTISASPDGKRIAYAGGHKQVCLIEIATGKQSWSYSADHRLYSVVFTADGKQVAASTDGAILLLDSARGSLLKTLRVASNRSVMSLQSSPDGKEIAAVSDDGKVRLLGLSEILRKKPE